MRLKLLRVGKEQENKSSPRVNVHCECVNLLSLCVNLQPLVSISTHYVSRRLCEGVHVVHEHWCQSPPS